MSKSANEQSDYLMVSNHQLPMDTHNGGVGVYVRDLEIWGLREKD